MQVDVGVASAAFRLPAARRTIAELCADEGADPAVVAPLGIESVPVCNGETGSELAIAAARDALQRAQLDPGQLDIIVEYSILPQEYLVPAWNMSNKLQHELGAKKAFTVGFSGGAATNFLLALSSAAAMIAADDKYNTALLVAADVAIPGNRIINPHSPVTVLGDSGGALLLRRGVSSGAVVDAEFHSDGANHDICYIQGGALANPDDPALYRLTIDTERYNQAPKFETMQGLLTRVLDRAGIHRDDVVYAVTPNLSAKDQHDFRDHLHFGPDQMSADSKTHGHLQGTDFVMNYLSMMESGRPAAGKYVIAASHGMGFMAGVALLRM